MYKTKNTLSSHLSFKFNDCKYDQINPNKEDASRVQVQINLL